MTREEFDAQLSKAAETTGMLFLAATFSMMVSVMLTIGLTFEFGSPLSLWLGCPAVAASLAVLGVTMSESAVAWLRRRIVSRRLLGSVRASALPAWTFSDGRFPEVESLVWGARLSSPAQECFDVLLDEWDGSLGELLVVSSAVVSSPKVA